MTNSFFCKIPFVIGNKFGIFHRKARFFLDFSNHGMKDGFVFFYMATRKI